MTRRRLLALLIVGAAAASGAGIVVGAFPSLESIWLATPLSLTLLAAGVAMAIWARDHGDDFYRDLWRDIAGALVAGSVISFAFGVIALDVDNSREARAAQLENLRFVRESLADELGPREFDGLDLRDQPLRGLDFSGSGPEGREVNLRGADLSGADLRLADLSGAQLSGVSARGADLRSANLSEASLAREIYCWPAREAFRPVDLSHARMSGAQLDGASVIGAEMSHTNLDGADLSGALLSEVNLQDASLRGANLDGTVIVDSDLSGADLEHARLDDVGHAGTRWPDGFDPPTSRPGGLSGGGGTCF